MSAARHEGDPADRNHDRPGQDADSEASYPRQDRRQMVDLTRVEAGEPERRSAFRRFSAEDETDS